MINHVQNRLFVVFGLARSGMATVDWLLSQGADVIVFDDAPHLTAQAVLKGARVVHADDLNWVCITAVVQSPGIPYRPFPHPFTKQALDHGIPIISDIDLLRQWNEDALFIGITGTNGKSTTTALVGHILQTTGRCVAVGGNIGTPALSLPFLGPKGIYVLELSSYQLDLSPKIDLDIGVLMNITDDHLERHGSVENYIHAKKNIFNNADIKILGVDSPYIQALFPLTEACSSLIPVSVHGHQKGGVFVNNNGILVDCTNETALDVGNLQKIKRLKGAHNYQNMAIAYTICRSVGLSVQEIMNGLYTFPGLEHRQEWVRSINGIDFINDSKGTNADATSHALEAFDDIFWIVGGQDKTEGIAPLVSYFPKVREAFLIGAAAHRFSETLEGKTPYHLCHTLEVAVQKAFERAKACRLSSAGSGADPEAKRKPVVLLSPACASFDQYKSFEHRGSAFKALVNALESSQSNEK